MNGGWPVVVFDFDPYVHLMGLSLRLDTLAYALAALAGIAWAGLIAGRTPAEEPATPGSEAPASGPGAGLPKVNAGVAAVGRGVGPDLDEQEPDDRHPDDDLDADAAEDEGRDGRSSMLRRDDLLFIMLGSIPGAVFLGRIGYGLLHLDWYGPAPRLLLDLSTGSAELTLAVIGGTLTGIYVAALLDAPVSRWLHVAIRPLLLALALAKLGQALGGSGQGAFVLDGSTVATAYQGTGPWGSLGAEIPAIPSQVHEALMAAVVLLIVAALGAFTGLRRPDGRLFGVGLGLWAFGRGLVATSWRDAPVAGTLKAEQVICLAVAAVSLSAAMIAWAWGRRASATRTPAPGAAA